MTHRFSCLLGSAALAALMSLSTSAQEYSNGGVCASGRKAAILTPVEAFGVHPPGLDPFDAKRLYPPWRQRYIPYYAPLSPVASTARWRPWAYYPLLPYYTPYYLGYCPHRLFNPPPRPYGSNGWGMGPKAELPLPEDPGTTPLDFGPYTSVVGDDTTFWNMGGNGLVPYGAAQAAPVGPPDLVDAIQASRPRGRAHAQRKVAPAGPAIVPPVEVPGEQQPGDGRGPDGTSKPAETIPPGKVLQEREDDLGPNRSSRRTKPAKLSLRGVSD